MGLFRGLRRLGQMTLHQFCDFWRELTQGIIEQ